MKELLLSFLIFSLGPKQPKRLGRPGFRRRLEFPLRSPWEHESLLTVTTPAPLPQLSPRWPLATLLKKQDGYEQSCQETPGSLHLVLKVQKKMSFILHVLRTLGWTIVWTKQNLMLQAKVPSILILPLMSFQCVFISGVFSFVKSHVALSLQSISAFSTVLLMFWLKDFFFFILAPLCPLYWQSP